MAAAASCPLIEDVRSTCFSLSRLCENMKGENADRHEQSISAISFLLDALSEDFDVVAQGPPRGDNRTTRQFQKALSHQKRARATLQEELDQSTGATMSGRISNLWYIRAGLSDPSIPAQTLSSFCRDFPTKETGAISKSTVSTVRDAMAEIV